MTFNAKLFAAAIGAALVLSFASASAATTDKAPALGSAGASLEVALNPQPLPPFVDPEHEDFEFDFG